MTYFFTCHVTRTADSTGAATGGETGRQCRLHSKGASVALLFGWLYVAHVVRHSVGLTSAVRPEAKHPISYLPAIVFWLRGRTPAPPASCAAIQCSKRPNQCHDSSLDLVTSLCSRLSWLLGSWLHCLVPAISNSLGQIQPRYLEEC